MDSSRLKFIQKALDINQKGLGRLLGLKGKTPDRTIRAWEKDEQTVTGPAALALEYLYQGTHRSLTQHGLAEHITATQQVKDHAGNTFTQELIIRLKRPRYIADRDSLNILIWIDKIEDFDEEELKLEAREFIKRNQ